MQMKKALKQDILCGTNNFENQQTKKTRGFARIFYIEKLSNNGI